MTDASTPEPERIKPKRRTALVARFQDEIIQRRLASESIHSIFRDIDARLTAEAEAAGTKKRMISCGTISDVYDEFIALRRQDRGEPDNAQLLEEALQDAEWLLHEAKAAWMDSRAVVVVEEEEGKDPVYLRGRGESKMLAEARQARAQINSLLGLEAATKVEHSGPGGGPIELDAPKARLSQMLASLGEVAHANAEAEA